MLTTVLNQLKNTYEVRRRCVKEAVEISRTDKQRIAFGLAVLGELMSRRDLILAYFSYSYLTSKCCNVASVPINKYSKIRRRLGDGV